MQKIVFNAHYLMYFDTAVADYWRALALPYEEAMQALGGDLYVRKATVEFNASARIDDLLDVGDEVRAHRQLVDDASRAPSSAARSCWSRCELVYVFADPATQTSKPVPPALREVLHRLRGRRADARGRAPATGRSWARAPADAHARSSSRSSASPPSWNGTRTMPTRRARGGVQPARARRSPPAGCCRPAPGVAKIGRMAVHRALRGGGLGAEVLQALARGGRRARRPRGGAACAAQRRRLLPRLGYVPRGEPFEEAGIAHIEMARRCRWRLTHGPQETHPAAATAAAAAPRRCRCRRRDRPAALPPPQADGASDWTVVGLLALMMFLAPALGVPQRGDAAGHAQVHRRVLRGTGRRAAVLLAAARAHASRCAGMR